MSDTAGKSTSRRNSGGSRHAHAAGPVPVGEVLPKLVQLLGLPSGDLISAVFQRWPDVVGADMARHCRPVSIDADRLVVVASDPMWADEIGWLSEQVLDQLAEASGGRRLSAIVVRVEPLS